MLHVAKSYKPRLIIIKLLVPTDCRGKHNMCRAFPNAASAEAAIDPRLFFTSHWASKELAHFSGKCGVVPKISLMTIPVVAYQGADMLIGVRFNASH